MDEVEEVREWRGRQLVVLKTRGLEVEWFCPVSVGDKLRVTGTFHYEPRKSFDPPRIDVSNGGWVEKLPPKKP